MSTTRVNNNRKSITHSFHHTICDNLIEGNKLLFNSWLSDDHGTCCLNFFATGGTSPAGWVAGLITLNTVPIVVCIAGTPFTLLADAISNVAKSPSSLFCCNKITALPPEDQKMDDLPYSSFNFGQS